jgi:hypothetical protein
MKGAMLLILISLAEKVISSFLQVNTNTCTNLHIPDMKKVSFVNKAPEL